MSLPNLISLARLLAVPVAVWLILAQEMGAAFWLFVAAGVSDAVDGFIAKRFNADTALGRYIDPLADKALLMSVYVALGVQTFLPAWLVILVVFRDVLIIGGALLQHLFTDQMIRMEPLRISKINTAAQIALAAVVLARLGIDVGGPLLSEILIYVVAASTLASGGAYLVRWVRGTAPVGDQ